MMTKHGKACGNVTQEQLGEVQATMNNKAKILPSLSILTALMLAWTTMSVAQAASAKDAKLIEAAKKGDTAAVQRLLQKGANIDVRDDYGDTPVVLAVYYDKTEIVKLLLEKGANIGVKDNGGSTALIDAAFRGNTEVVKLLLEKGANIEAKDNNGDTALNQAALFKKTEALKLLLEKGANTETKNNSGLTALLTAVNYRYLEGVKLLLEKGANIEAKDNLGLTALLTATYKEYPEIVKLLVDNGANIEAKDNSGRTSLETAKIWENKEMKEIVEVLSAAGTWVGSMESYLSKIQAEKGKNPFKRIQEKVFVADITNDPGVVGKGHYVFKTTCGLLRDAYLRKKVIRLAATMNPPPAIPEAARAAFIKAATFLKAAKDEADYQYAIEAYYEALCLAPWWGNAYYNLAMALDAAGFPDDAITSLNLYIETKPADADVAQAKAKIIEIAAKGELAEKKEAAMRAKYGGQEGGSGYSFDSLYRYGAVVQDMSFDASGNARTISLKTSTLKENGRLVDYLVISDMTSPSDTFWRKFSVVWRGEQTFYLDDRSRPGKESMVLTVTSFGDGDAKISVRPSDNASASIQTTLADLFRERARQAVYAGSKFDVEGKTFYVLGQGGSTGALLFFQMEIKDKLEQGEVRDLSPMFVANVNHRTAAGQDENLANPDLGVLNGTHYHLELEGGHFVAKVGQGQDH